MSGRPIRVVLADDHPMVRRGLRETLQEAGDVEVCGEAENGARSLEALDALATSGRPADVLVTDLTMPEVDGLELLARARHAYPELAVLVLSIHLEAELGLTVLQAGAAGYLEKRTAPDMIVEAVRQAAAGERYLSAGLAARLAEAALSGRAPGAPDVLSPRELQVVRAIASGQSRAETMDALALSASALSTYRRRALDKLGLDSDAELARYAADHGLVE